MTLVLLVVVAEPVAAQVCPPSRVEMTWDNDLMAGTDRHYTNGIRLALFGSVFDGEWGLAVGQRIYTPEDVEAREVVADDRPFGGWLYLEAALRRRHPSLRAKDGLTLQVGVVGPSAAGAVVHEAAHAAFGSRSPQGWRNQLRDEPALGLAYRFEVRALRGAALGFDYDVTPHAALSLGNVTTHAALGVALRVGHGVPNEFAAATPTARPLRVYLQASAEVRAVAFDAFLDGNLLRPARHRVEREWLVADLTVGVRVVLLDRVTIGYSHTVRTREFKAQDGPDQFGAFSLALSW